MYVQELQFQSIIDSVPLSGGSICSYFQDKISRTKAFIYPEKLNPLFVECLLREGFRRCGDLYYQTNCPSCNLCMSYRLPLERFSLTKSQKRVLQRNQDLTVTFSRPNITDEKKTMYLEYQYAQHFLKPSDNTKERFFNPEQTLYIMYEQMYRNTHNSIEMELRLQHKLMGFIILDIAERSVSAVYSVYDPYEKRRSSGTAIILKSIEWAQKNNFQYYYLGYYIPGHKKMDYKARFKPAQIRDQKTGAWFDFKQ